jgi:hypothetical protein
LFAANPEWAGRSLKAGNLLWAAAARMPSGPTGSRNAARPGQSPKALFVCRADHTRIYRHANHHVEFIDVSAVAAIAAGTAHAADSALPAYAGGLLVVAIAAVLPLAARPAGATLPAGLTVAALCFNAECAVDRFCDRYTYAQRRIAAINAGCSRNTGCAGVAAMAALSGVVMIPPERTAIIRICRFCGLGTCACVACPFRRSCRNEVRCVRRNKRHRVLTDDLKSGHWHLSFKKWHQEAISSKVRVVQLF